MGDVLGIVAHHAVAEEKPVVEGPRPEKPKGQQGRETLARQTDGVAYSSPEEHPAELIHVDSSVRDHIAQL